MSEPLYPFSQIEAKWQGYWLSHKTFKTEDPSASSKAQKKVYILDMFPYPSGAGLHVGHPEGYTATDIYSRYKRMRGYHVMHPMGWDAFGLPAEQYAIETGTHPAITTQKNISTFRAQIQKLGLSYDWDRQVDTTDESYVRWTQWIFLQLYKKDLAYLAEVPVWWCEALGCVLANEEVVDGRSERGNHPVVRKPMRQWMLKITAYADRLLEDLALVDWSDSIKQMQHNWIGRSEGAQVTFKVDGFDKQGFSVDVFTTRPDTLFGATYLVLAPEHELVPQITLAGKKMEVEAYQKKVSSKSELERTELSKEKTGVFTGAYAINPVNGQKLPIWIADYVLSTYGTGAIMAVPAHDQRDHDFATAFSLPIIEVVQGSADILKAAYCEDGPCVNSGFLNGLKTVEAKKAMIDHLEKNAQGTRKVSYKLRDWLFSRQRYWGEPIPVVHCVKCGIVALDEKDLPLRLPQMSDFKPSGNAEPPLAKASDWVNTSCPKCHGPAKRETNTMPQWAGSCWYYLRYLDPKNDKSFCEPVKEKYWMNVDLYVGGAEHAVLHLLYSRFWHKVLYDLGHVSTKEPFLKLVNQGMILGEDGQKMSKSRGNVINPDSVIAEYGADSMRLYEMFMGPLTQMKSWSMKGVEGVYRFLGKVWRLCVDREGNLDASIVDEPMSDEQAKLLHKTLKKVTLDIEGLDFNTCISAMMMFVNEVSKLEKKPRALVEPFILMLSVFAPHLCEEIWQKLGHAQSTAYVPWPAYDEKWCQDSEIEIPIMINGKVRSKLVVSVDWDEAAVESRVMADEKIVAEISGKTIVQKKYVPKKIYTLAIK